VCCGQAFQQLEELVKASDVVFLLTDTRESRWLPSLLAAAHGKVAITAALGFDGYVVMRHGLPAPGGGAAGGDVAGAVGSAATAAAGGGGGGGGGGGSSSKQRQLGCYFCNDVVAPLNSTIDRTLDQQCTVARPGLAPIAGALATELLAALLQHPLKGYAPAEAAGGALGPVPHMIRGQLSGFSQVVMQGVAFSQCTACSPAVLEAYRRDGWGFVAKVLQNPKWLEELTGLAELQRQMLQMELELAAAAEDEATAAGGTGAGASGSDDDWAEL
jgi:ubiquitin-like modifier-activating enzyme ATG7